MRSILIVFICFVTTTLAITACNKTTDDNPDSITIGGEKFAVGSSEEVSDIPIQASTLASAYMRQEDAANERYKGKTIQVKGVIGRVSITKDNIPYITMSGSGGWNIQCIFPSTWSSDTPDTAIGQPAVIKGRVEGVMDDVSPDPSSIFTTAGRRLTMVDCEVIE